jgi:hypothetical protein
MVRSGDARNGDPVSVPNMSISREPKAVERAMITTRGDRDWAALPQWVGSTAATAAFLLAIDDLFGLGVRNRSAVAQGASVVKVPPAEK